MNTFETMASAHEIHCQDGAAAPVWPDAFPALPVFGAAQQGAKPAGVALAFAGEASEISGEDRFMLALVDAQGRVFDQLGPFCEEEVVAVWRDIAQKAGLARMIVREDGELCPVSQQLGRLALGKTRMRRRHGSLCDRRPRFLVRRKTGRLPARPLIHRGEKEIIART